MEGHMAEVTVGGMAAHTIEEDMVVMVWVGMDMEWAMVVTVEDGEWAMVVTVEDGEWATVVMVEVMQEEVMVTQCVKDLGIKVLMEATIGEMVTNGEILEDTDIPFTTWARRMVSQVTLALSRVMIFRVMQEARTRERMAWAITDTIDSSFQYIEKD
jgi:hypothetical protein